MDIWSSGITLYTMLCGYLPFEEESKSCLYDKILSCKFAIPKYISRSGVDLIKKVLVRDPLNRLNIEGILNHEWMQRYRSNVNIHLSIDAYNKIDLEILQMVALETSTDVGILRSMINDNQHNDMTTQYYPVTRYYLLMKKKKRKEEEDLHNVRKDVHMVSLGSPYAHTGPQNATNKLLLKKNTLKVNLSSTIKSRKNSSNDNKPLMTKTIGSTTNKNKNDLTFKMKKPPIINLKDITVEVNEKITFNTTTSATNRYKGADTKQMQRKNSRPNTNNNSRVEKPRINMFVSFF